MAICLPFLPLLLVGLFATGSFDARAANAPLSLDLGSRESREDLFSSRSGNPAPATGPDAPVPRVEPPPLRTQAPSPISDPASAVPRVAGGNPLWAIPLASLTATRERPLFAPSRRPPPPVPVAAPVAARPPPPPPKPPEPEPPPLTLLGTIAGSQLAAGVGLFLDTASKAVLSLKAGENHKGWTLRAVRPRQVELARGLDTAILDLPAPDLKPGPAAPVQAAQPAMPASPGQPNPPIQVNTANAVLPPGLPPGLRGPQPAPQPPPPRPRGPFERQDLPMSRQPQR
jgi:general secretion pathway protein N